ncbi:MAG: hypothetical protein KBD26_00515 [Candidatus Pacebacteria bacterium]|nr:hypothetical protein [Candidatus Paceibacterota bacterium]MBP9772292.1 hypothetical protein [Candidatus Paceibacterota bacterium]
MENFKNEKMEIQSFLEDLTTKHSDGSVVERDEISKSIEEFDLENFLEKIVSLGFVIHGSSKFFETAKPHPAKDDNSVPENEHYAIYATDLPAIAIYMSIVSNDKIHEQKKSIHWGAGVIRHANGNRIPVFSADQDLSDVMDDGYLYLFKKENFSPVTPNQMEEQFVSHESLKPVLIIKTKPSDFKYSVQPLK